MHIALEDLDNHEEDPPTCLACNGSGAGMFGCPDTYRCQVCKGRGVLSITDPED